jgi:hypothetical protein
MRGADPPAQGARWVGDVPEFDMTTRRVEGVRGMNGRRFHVRRVGAITALLTLAAVLVSPPATAADPPDQVLAWNHHAYDELIVLTAPPLNAPPVAVMHLAIVHGAIYDAVNAIDGGYQPYLGSPTADGTDSEDAAAATAGYRMLQYLLPSDRDDELLAYYEDSLDAILDAGVTQAAVDGGVAVGEAAAAAMVTARTGDGRYGDPSFTVDPTPEPGDWVPFAAGTLGNNFKWVGDVDPFLIQDAADFATGGPLELTSAKYAAEFNEVKALGRATGSTRTPDQTEQALFWADHATAMWTRIFWQLSDDQDLSTTENARFFAMLYLTGADAAISCFQDKERWGFWRPQRAIQLAGSDGNPKTVADQAWTSLLPNPPYPDHPSGHNCLSSSIVNTLRDFFGTNRMSFSATHATLGITRSFTRFKEAIGEIRHARVYGGLHFMTADAHGVTLGRKVAKFREEHYFQPA